MPNVANKRRVLTDAILLDSANLPAFPSGPNADGRVVFAGDMTGALISGMEWVISGTFDLTSLNGKLQTSDDGVTWHDVDGAAFTAASAVGSEYVELDPDSTQFKRYVRVALTAGAAGTTTNVEVALLFQQCAARGVLSPPGKYDTKF